MAPESLSLRAGIVAWALVVPALVPATARADGAGNAIVLDGIHGYLGCDLPAAIRGCSEITLSAWIQREGPAGEILSPEPRGQAAVGLGFHLGLSAGKILFTKGTGSDSYVVLIGTTAAPISSWHHVAATFDGSTMRVYLDGVLDGSLADGATAEWADLPFVYPPGQTNWPSPAQLYLGADKHNDVGDGATIPDFAFYEGFMDEAQIWNRALSQSEIESFRHVSLTGTELGLVAYWKFDEGTGTSTADASQHQGDLTLYPGATWAVSTAPVNKVNAVPSGEAGRQARLTAFPNPTAGPATILLEAPSAEPARVTVFDQAGRRIANLWSGSAAASGRLTLQWNGRDQAGRRVACGVYLVRFESATARFATRLLILR